MSTMGIVFFDGVLTSIGKSIMGGRIRLCDENMSGDQLAIEGLGVPDQDVVVASLKDLACAADNELRRDQLLAYTSHQFNIIIRFLERKIDSFQAKISMVKHTKPLENTSLFGRLAKYFNSHEYSHVLRLYEAAAFLNLAITVAARTTGAAHGTAGWDKVESHVGKILDIMKTAVAVEDLPRFARDRALQKFVLAVEAERTDMIEKFGDYANMMD